MRRASHQRRASEAPSRPFANNLLMHMRCCCACYYYTALYSIRLTTIRIIVCVYYVRHRHSQAWWASLSSSARQMSRGEHHWAIESVGITPVGGIPTDAVPNRTEFVWNGSGMPSWKRWVRAYFMKVYRLCRWRKGTGTRIDMTLCG